MDEETLAYLYPGLYDEDHQSEEMNIQDCTVGQTLVDFTIEPDLEYGFAGELQ